METLFPPWNIDKLAIGISQNRQLIVSYLSSLISFSILRCNPRVIVLRRLLSLLLFLKFLKPSTIIVISPVSYLSRIVPHPWSWPFQNRLILINRPLLRSMRIWTESRIRFSRKRGEVIGKNLGENGEKLGNKEEQRPGLSLPPFETLCRDLFH